MVTSVRKFISMYNKFHCEQILFIGLIKSEDECQSFSCLNLIKAPAITINIWLRFIVVQSNYVDECAKCLSNEMNKCHSVERASKRISIIHMMIQFM